MLAENYKIVPVMNSADISTGSDCDSINMANYHKATFIFTFGTVTTDVTFTPKTGISEGTKTNAVVTKYAAGGAIIGTAVAASTASCDVLAAWTASTTTIVLSAATNKVLVVEISAAAMTSGDNWLTVTLAAGTGGICHAVAILEPRYGSSRIGTCLK
jgi:hypothetical protein